MRLGEDLAAVSSALRIRQDHLEAIEEGAFDRLPGRAYAMGFVRAYAEYLGLDAPAIVARFKEESGVPPEPTHQPHVFEEASAEEPRQPQGLLIGLLVLFLVGLGFAIYFAQSADKMLAQNTVPTPTTAPAPAPAHPETAQAVAPPVPTPETAPAPAVAAKPQQAIPPAVVADGTPDGQSFGATTGASRVTIKSLRNGVWLRVEDQTTGEVLITRKLKAGDKFLVPDRPNLILVTRDGGSLELVLDGTQIGRAGGPGTVIDGMSLNADALAGRLPATPAAAGTPPGATPGAASAPAQGTPAKPQADPAAPPATPPKPVQHKVPATPPAATLEPAPAPVAPSASPPPPSDIISPQ
jgi:cytoskeleton protein RodZ